MLFLLFKEQIFNIYKNTLKNTNTNALTLYIQLWTQIKPYIIYNTGTMTVNFAGS